MKKTGIFLTAVSLTAPLFIGAVKAESIPRSMSIDTRKSMEEYVLGACHFEIENLFEGHLIAYANTRPPRATYYVPANTSRGSSVMHDGFSLDCRETTTEQLSTALNAKYESGQWLSSGPAYGPEFVPFDKPARVQTIPLKGTNWTAMAYTADDTTGDERIRARRFHFCLIHDAYALCGETPVIWLENRKVNDLWKVKSILQSIRFIDTATSTDTAGSATTTESAINLSVAMCRW